MADRFTGRRCQDCQGGLIYNKQDKFWECPYCGKIYERELNFNKVQIDGMAGLNDVARSTLSNLINLDFQTADKELLECEKLDHASVITLIVKVSVSLFKSFYAKDRQAELNKVNALLPKFSGDFAEVEEAEEVFYDFIDSADLYGLLTVVFSMIGQKNRMGNVYERLDCKEVLNSQVSKYLLNVLVKTGEIESADILLGNMAAENGRFALSVVLNSYPSTPAKPEHVKRLLKKTNTDSSVAKLFDAYFENTKDEGSVVTDTFLHAVACDVEFTTSKVIHSVLRNCHSFDDAKKTFAAFGQQRLDEETASAVLSWASVTTDHADVAEMAYSALFRSNSVFEITDEDVFEVFNSGKETALIQAKCKAMLSTFKMSGRTADRIFAYHVLENRWEPEERKETFVDLLGHVVSVPLAVLEDYVLKVNFDGATKAEILSLCFGKMRSPALAAELFSKYLRTRIDAPDTREAVITVFLNQKLQPDPATFGAYLLNGQEKHSDALLALFDRMGCKTASNTFDSYLMQLTDASGYDPRVAALATKHTFTLRAAQYVRYLLYAKEPDVQKARNAMRYAGACMSEMREARFSFVAANEKIQGNAAQMYFLIGRDSPAVMLEILNFLQRERVKLDAPLETVSDGKKVKMRKFVDTHLPMLQKNIAGLAKELL